MSTPEGDQQRKDLTEHFFKLDSDGDGQLNFDEFRNGLGTLGLDQSFVRILFNSFDKDGSGKIERNEFLASMAVMLNPADRDAQIQLAFDAYDTNKDGRLVLPEVYHVISSLFATMEKMGIRDYMSASAEDTARELFRCMDIDNKGYVTKEDYAYLATHNPDMLKKVGLGGAPALSKPSVKGGGARYGVPPARPTLERRGTTISFGHKNWELVVQMMLAIRLSVGRAAKISREEEAAAAAAAAAATAAAATAAASLGKTATSSPDCSSSSFPLRDEHYRDVWHKKIPGHARGQDTTVDFKDYAPLAFRRVRQLFGISDSVYMLSLGPEQILGELLLGTIGSLSELFSEGKSGSFFYFSNDGRYLIKTIPHRELRSLIHILPQYVVHVESQPHTLLPRFMGAHRLMLPHGHSKRVRKVHFIVMTNVFNTSRAIHHRYDLKGSTQGRTTGEKVLKKHPDMVRKDLDVLKPFQLKPAARDALTAQVCTDLNCLACKCSPRRPPLLRRCAATSTSFARSTRWTTPC